MMELLTCPCCGSLPEVEITPEAIQVRCLDCGLQMKKPDKDPALVIAAWNRRVRYRASQ